MIAHIVQKPVLSYFKVCFKGGYFYCNKHVKDLNRKICCRLHSLKYKTNDMQIPSQANMIYVTLAAMTCAAHALSHNPSEGG
jgi:hypothetical protein